MIAPAFAGAEDQLWQWAMAMIRPGAALIAAPIFGAAQVLISTFVSPILGSIAVAVLAALVLRISPKGFSRA